MCVKPKRQIPKFGTLTTEARLKRYLRIEGWKMLLTHCERCGHKWRMAFRPQDIRGVAMPFKKPGEHCPQCGSPKILSGVRR